MFEWIFVLSIMLDGQMVGKATFEFATAQLCEAAQSATEEDSSNIHPASAYQTHVGECFRRISL